MTQGSQNTQGSQGSQGGGLEAYRVARAADRHANRNYLKSRVVMGLFRRCQRWRDARGPVARLSYAVHAALYVGLTSVLGIELPPSTRVGPGLRLRHGVGLVVNPRSVIGANVMIRHGVTLGNRRTRTDCPTIGDDVEIGAGAVIIGAVTIGKGARIGPNCVVITDVPAGATVLSPLGVVRDAAPPA